MKRYFNTLKQVVMSPKDFFNNFDGHSRLPAVTFLVASSIVSALSGMVLGPHPANLIQGSILLVNNFGMIVLAVIVAYAVMVPLAGSGIGFKRIFNVYAYSAGATLLFSWNPALIMLTEPWRWWLTWNGMRIECGLSALQSAIILTLSIVMIVTLVWVLIPFTVPQ